MKMVKFTTYEEIGKEVAEKVLDEYIYKGKTLREWIDILAKTRWIPVTERLPEKNDIYVVWTSKGFGDHLSTSYYNTEDGWTIGVCAWKENVESYNAENEE